VTRWPSTGAGDAGWSPGFLDRAETFSESDVTLSHDSTTVENESVVFSSDPVRGDTANVAYSQTAIANDGAENGLAFTPNEPLEGIRVETDENIGRSPDLELREAGSSTVLDSVSSVDPSTEYELTASLSADTDYWVVLYRSGDNYDNGRADESYPVETADVDVTAGVYQGAETDQYACSFKFVETLVEPLNASVTVEWPMPDDVAGWDIIPYQVTKDGGNVEVYAVDPNDGSELAGPLEDPGDISNLPRSTNVAVKVVLSRPSTSENPRLEAVYRRRKIT